MPERPPNRIAELRIAAGMRPVTLAAALDIDQSTLWRWEQGKSAISDDDKLALAALFDVDVPYLMGWEAVREWEPVG